MQPSPGSQADPQKIPPGKAFLSAYSDAVAQAIEKLKSERIPSSFQQGANGAVAQDLIANKENYV